MQRTAPLLIKAKKQFRMWMPQYRFTLVGAKNATAEHPPYATFRTDPKITKHEIREYLTKIYKLPVKTVNTQNYEGRRKRMITPYRGVIHYKYPDYKKAIVYFEDGFDIGIGTRIPEMEDADAAPQKATATSDPSPKQIEG